MIAGATQSAFRYLNLKADLNIHYDPSKKPDILWAHYSYDQPIYQTENLHNIKHIVTVSDWQKQMFVKYLKIHPNKIYTIRNGGSDHFYYSGTTKSKTFVYTSTPFRGLKYLPEIWRRIVEKHPDAKLKVFSSMSLYGQEDPKEFLELYEEINSLPNARHYYPVQHKELAEHLRDASYFIYPNIWEETSCVSLIEAMRSGCIPILTDLGALSETAKGYAELIQVTGTNTTTGWILDQDCINRFIDQTLKAIDTRTNHQELANFACSYYDWNSIRDLWNEYIGEITMSSDKLNPVSFEKATSDDYLEKAKQYALQWQEKDAEFAQGTSNFQIEKFIGLTYHTVSHAYENILRNRRALAESLFAKTIEMTEKQREFEYKWKDQPKDQPIWWNADKDQKKLVWFDLDEKQHELYMRSSENSLRDMCARIDYFDKILHALEEKNGGPITREQLELEAPENWKRRFANKIFDDMVSRQTGITPTVVEGVRHIIADELVPGSNNKIGVDFMDFRTAIEAPGNYMSLLAQSIQKSMDIDQVETKTAANHKLTHVASGTDSWFNRELIDDKSQ